MYDEIKQALGRSQNKNSPLKFCYGRDNPGPSATDGALGRTLLWAVCQREYGVFGSTERHRLLTLDNEPTKVELKEALEYLHLEKRAARMVIPGCGWYSACARGKKGTTMMRDANIVTLYKNRPARRDCTNNYQGIEFPSIAIKLFARVVVKGLQVLAERLYPESWCGFPAKRSILLGLIACPARRSVWSRLRRNGHKRYLHLTWLVCVCVCVRVCVLMNNKTTKE